MATINNFPLQTRAISLATTSTTNAVVRFKDATGGTQSSGVTVDDSNAVVIPSTATTTEGGAVQAPAISVSSGGLGQGIFVNQTGTGIAGSLSKPPAFNDIFISADNLDYGSGFVTGFNLVHVIQGEGAKGGREAFNALIQLNTSTGGADNPNHNYVGVTGQAIATVSDGGTDASSATTSYGALFGGGFAGWAKSTATNLLHVTGFEADVQMDTGSSAWAKSIATFTLRDGDDVNGTSVNTGIWMYAAGTGSALLDSAILIDNNGGGGASGDHYGRWPLKTTGTILKTGGGGTLANGIDISDTTFSGSAFKSTGFAVNGTGGIAVNGDTTYGLDTHGASFTGQAIRLGNGQSIVVRNAADSADLPLLSIDASNNLDIAGNGFPGVIVTWSNVVPGQNVTWSLGSATNRYTTTHEQSVTLYGSTSGNTVLKPAATASGTITLPAGTTDFSETGGTSQVVKQTTAGGPFTVGQLEQADISGLTTSDSPAFEALKIGSDQVMGARSTGWTTLTGTATKAAGSWDTGSVTLPQLAQVVKAMIDSSITQGYRGA
jgi:hypothetical protein